MSKAFDVLTEVINHADFPVPDCWQLARYQPNEEIIRSGDKGECLYMIRRGRVRVIGKVELEQDRQVKPGMADLDTGEIFGELVLFDQAPRSATVMALEQCELAVIDSEKLRQFLQANPELGFRFLRELTSTLVGRLRHANDKIYSLLAWGLKAHGIDKHL